MTGRQRPGTTISLCIDWYHGDKDLLLLFDQSAPSVQVQLKIVPDSFRLGDEVKLSISVTSDATITLFTWPTILNLSLAQRRKNFSLLDLSTDPPLQVKTELTKGPKRTGYSRTKGHSDEAYFVTLEPGQPLTLEGDFDMNRRTIESAGANRGLIPGHHYRLAVHDEQIWWKKGTRDEVMVTGKASSLGEADGPHVSISASVEFDVLE